MAIAAALISLFRDQPIKPDLAMTGEVTLTGRVLPVGGVREKILAARRAGIKTVLIPRHNEKDLVEIPAEVKADLTFGLVDTPRRRRAPALRDPGSPGAAQARPRQAQGAARLTAEKTSKIKHQTRPRRPRSRTPRPPRRPRTV